MEQCGNRCVFVPKKGGDAAGLKGGGERRGGPYITLGRKIGGGAAVRKGRYEWVGGGEVVSSLGDDGG